MTRAVLRFSTSQLGIEHHGRRALGVASVGGLAAATLAKELGAVDGFGDGLAEPRGADEPDDVGRAGGNYRLPGGMRLERESLAAVCLGQHIVKALRQLVERFGRGGELARLGVQDACLADASPHKPRAGLAGAAGDMQGHPASKARRPGDGSTRPMARRRREACAWWCRGARGRQRA